MLSCFMNMYLVYIPFLTAVLSGFFYCLETYGSFLTSGLSIGFGSLAIILVSFYFGLTYLFKQEKKQALFILFSFVYFVVYIAYVISLSTTAQDIAFSSTPKIIAGFALTSAFTQVLNGIKSGIAFAFRLGYGLTQLIAGYFVSKFGIKGYSSMVILNGCLIGSILILPLQFVIPIQFFIAISFSIVGSGFAISLENIDKDQFGNVYNFLIFWVQKIAILIADALGNLKNAQKIERSITQNVTQQLANGEVVRKTNILQVISYKLGITFYNWNMFFAAFSLIVGIGTLILDRFIKRASTNAPKIEFIPLMKRYFSEPRMYIYMLFNLTVVAFGYFCQNGQMDGFLNITAFKPSILANNIGLYAPLILSPLSGFIGMGFISLIGSLLNLVGIIMLLFLTKNLLLLKIAFGFLGVGVSIQFVPFVRIGETKSKEEAPVFFSLMNFATMTFGSAILPGIFSKFSIINSLKFFSFVGIIPVIISAYFIYEQFKAKQKSIKENS